MRRDLTIYKLLGRCDNDRQTILLHSRLQGEELRLTLLHEMCHMGKGPGYAHGPVFLRKVRRLVKLGESKLIDDVEQYDGTAMARYFDTLPKHTIHEVSFREAVTADLDSLAQIEYRRRWPKVLAFLADKYKITPSQFRRAAPWAQRQWEEDSALYRQDDRRRRRLTGDQFRKTVTDHFKSADGFNDRAGFVGTPERRTVDITKLNE